MIEKRRLVSVLATCLGVSFAVGQTRPALSPAAAEQLLHEAIAKMKSLDHFECESTLTVHLSGGERSAGADITDFLDISAIRSKGFKMTLDGRPAPVRPFRGEMAVNSFLNSDAACLLVTCDLNNLSEGPPPVKPVITAIPQYASFNGKICQVVCYKIGGGFPEEYKFFIGPDKIVYRVYHYADNMGRPYIYDSVINKLNMTPNFVAADFDPKASEVRPGRNRPTGVGAGDLAPDFTLPTPDGRPTTLKEAMKDQKVLLLNFWFVNCPPCRSEHPHLDALHKELQSKGFGVLSIDLDDSAAKVAKYLKGAGLQFNVALGGASNGPTAKELSAYRVESCPTNILIDCSTGKVISRESGWNEAKLRATLAREGIQ